jgi:hypothetical protein
MRIQAAADELGHTEATRITAVRGVRVAEMDDDLGPQATTRGPTAGLTGLRLASAADDERDLSSGPQHRERPRLL